MQNKQVFEYQQNPKFNIGDEVLMVFRVNDVTELATSLVFKGAISWMRISIDVEPRIVSSYAEQTQTYSCTYYVDIYGERTDRHSDGSNVFFLDEMDKAQALANQYLSAAKDENEAMTAQLERLGGSDGRQHC
ncbi:hypothetical protein ACPSLY_16155 [Vibrio parahaemolyticus]|uniref:hypothetical protein n=1 Tax=Vibrio parahaemolyticus TaxID=670 RepID=UPI0011221382|nr:hypothetical protein [Vibrio parahaemolyticus]MCZ6372490.1 hypothetical protein [Vibrio parahaemolyticus]MDF4503329.1 hypothetical protein [Vibrio parahaemolyticus]MDG2809895.1 hypothetical protein [Vibrio parahaemolyticus]MDG3428154.1 hypothetical protein [Vibrio parahaemolyticus]TOR07209.1 hypothetical protein CGG82_23885 [Vibrio parahaemolyticus]